MTVKHATSTVNVMAVMAVTANPVNAMNTEQRAGNQHAPQGHCGPGSVLPSRRSA